MGCGILEVATKKGLAIKPCSNCGNAWHKNFARGLCSACKYRAGIDGTIDDHPRVKVPYAELMEDIEWLRTYGYTERQVAEKLNIKWETYRDGLRRSMRKWTALMCTKERWCVLKNNHKGPCKPDSPRQEGNKK